MVIIISSAKTLAENSKMKAPKYSLPQYTDEAQVLVDVLRELPAKELGKLLGINAKLAQLNAERFGCWHLPFNSNNAIPAVFLYKGDVYKGLNVEQFSADDLLYAQDHLRIISGLYGILRPLDLIQPYRLEMSTPLSVGNYNDLYQFWSDKVTESLIETIKQQQNRVLINLASNEYSQVVNLKKLNAKVITPVFYEMKEGDLKPVSIFLKKARGLMASYIIRNRITNPEEIKLFSEERYSYIEQYSDEERWVFAR
ncbi:MAG: peroxide stress protein YaaA [Bacteroidales bacterium]|nr:peroxide stress protein YaaA [Bacteroidales bacterium]